MPNCCSGRSGAPHASHSTAKADEKRASHAGQRASSSPPQAVQAAGSSSLGLLEVPLSGAAAQADGHPVAEHLPALLPQPVGCLAHLSVSRARRG